MTATGTAARGIGLAMGPRLRTLIVVVVTAGAIGLTAWFVNRPSSGGLTAINIEVGPGSRPVVGALPPDFGARTVDGKAFRLSDYAGKPVWLTFGASWCADCRAEAADLEATYAKFRDQVVVVGVFIQENDAAVREYAGRVGFTFTMTADPDARVAAAYHTLGIPTHFFIGRDGRIREVRLGGLERADMERLVRSLLD